ncbi:hypothetical protein [Streptomyces sp. HNM0574]|uniref:hypothetical protein n=1 Tax=Streptomyces sp. HNM0574 TaxID=2714954 RepID=UPI00146B7064|nr:hypothetical protein [Streptomyces sp. HNM0574]NLU67041.1 hypothetical protein [Streptomyces sp. HNM0574]
MRVNRTASAALVAALSGSLALGASGTAFASAAGPDRASAAEASRAAETTTAQQFRVVEHLGELARLTGHFGRIAQEERTTRQQLEPVRVQLKERGRQLLDAVAKAAPENRPASAPADRRVPALADSVRQFGQTVDRAAGADRATEEQRSRAVAGLVPALSSVTEAAAHEAGLPRDAVRPQQAQQPSGAQRPGDQEQFTQQQREQAEEVRQAQAGLVPLSAGSSGEGRKGPAKPVPGADKLLKQTQTLDSTSDVVNDVSELVRDVLKADNGKLSPAKLKEHREDVNASVDKARRAAPARAAGPAAADLRAESLAQLKAKALALLKTSTKGDVKKTGAAARATVKASVDFIAGTLSSKQLPKADLSGLKEQGRAGSASQPAA